MSETCYVCKGRQVFKCGSIGAAARLIGSLTQSDKAHLYGQCKKAFKQGLSVKSYSILKAPPAWWTPPPSKSQLRKLRAAH